MEQIYIELLAVKSGLRTKQIENTLKLFSEGCTIPFIARYRKDQTGNMDEIQISELQNHNQKLSELIKRKRTILESITEQGLLTETLKNKIESEWDSNKLEDIYLPYKPKRRTKAGIAKENGLEPFAKMILHHRSLNPDSDAVKYINKNYPDSTSVLQGARDILAEWISEDENIRSSIRSLYEREAVIQSKKSRKAKEDSEKYKDYFSYQEKLSGIPSHRLHAIYRGENEDALSVHVLVDEAKAQAIINRKYLKGGSSSNKQLQSAGEESLKRLIYSSMETEFRNKSKIKADKEAIQVFGENVRQLLLSPPLGQKRVLAIDPGYKTGCKIVCLDSEGKLLHNETIYPHPPQKEYKQSASKIKTLCESYKIEAIAIGNGTAGRETEDFIRNIVFPAESKLQVYSVSESGASIYSASSIAREEFPGYDVTVRGAVSIGRRLMDPLSELVKIDPKSIGVGQYQHDVDQQLLKQELNTIVENCVNRVGVDVNTASKYLLTYVSGLGSQLASNIVNYRDQYGKFNTRSELMKVPKLGAKTYEQCAGFLRITGGDNPLDNSAVHPESYTLVEKIADDLRIRVTELIGNEEKINSINTSKYEILGYGVSTVSDIKKELAKPSRDPRSVIRVREFDRNIRKTEDLREGMELDGIVTNITKFGCFVDIGVKQDGLVHISELREGYVRDVGEVVKINDWVRVRVVGVDLERKRIAFSMK
jgi:uncharacterized protein